MLIKNTDQQRTKKLRQVIYNVSHSHKLKLLPTTLNIGLIYAYFILKTLKSNSLLPTSQKNASIMFISFAKNMVITENYIYIYILVSKCKLSLLRDGHSQDLKLTEIFVDMHHEFYIFD